MSVDTKSDFIRQIESLPPLPASARHIQSVTSAPNTSADHIAQVLKGDAAVASRVLRVVNSSFYGVGREVTQISRAVVILGGRAIRNLVLGVHARNSLLPSDSQAKEHAVLWGHSVATATLCDGIARKIGFSPPEEAFLAGLLHDAGKLAMVTFDAEIFRKTVGGNMNGASRLNIEREYFGIDHAEAGAQVFTRWGLPEMFCDVARRHHTPDLDMLSDTDQLVAIVIVANHFAQVAGYDLDSPSTEGSQVGRLVEAMGLSDDDHVSLFAGLDRSVGETTRAFTASEATLDILPDCVHWPEVIWISPDHVTSAHLGRAWLKAKGSNIRMVADPRQAPQASPEHLFVVDMGPDANDAACAMARKLSANGFHRMVVLSDPEADEPLRRQTGSCGVCHIPRAFSAFDFKWVGEQLGS